MTNKRISIGLGFDFLANKMFRLVRVDNGATIIDTLTFVSGGELRGYRVGRHWSWDIIEGNLVFRNNHNELTDVFDRFDIYGTSISVIGHLHSQPDNYWIRLMETPGFDPSALVPFRTTDDPPPGRTGRTVVLVRSHRADAKFDDLMAKLSRGRQEFDLYAMLDSSRNAITCRLENTLYFNAEACTAIGLAWPHPSLFHQYGDVAMSYVYRQIPGYAFYIMVDDDLDLLDDDASLFNEISRAVHNGNEGIDLLGLIYQYRPLTTHGFALLKVVPEHLLRYCYYPFIGLSARAAAFLFSQRQLEFARGAGLQDRPMCEIFVPTLLHAAGFVCRDLKQVIPGAYTAANMLMQERRAGYGRPMGYDRTEFKSDRMIHPVYTAEQFVIQLQRHLRNDNPDDRRMARSVLEGPIGDALPQALRRQALLDFEPVGDELGI